MFEADGNRIMLCGTPLFRVTGCTGDWPVTIEYVLNALNAAKILDSAFKDIDSKDRAARIQEAVILARTTMILAEK